MANYVYNADNEQPVSTSNPLPVNPTGTTSQPIVETIQNVIVLSSTARNTSGDTSATPINCSKYKEAIAFVDVTAFSGTTPTLDVKFQTQDPVSLKWFDIPGLIFTQKTAIANEMKTVNGLLGGNLQCVYTIGGTTPIFTFSVGMVLKS